jgi:hypothetical protein
LHTNIPANKSTKENTTIKGINSFLFSPRRTYELEMILIIAV